MQNIEDICAYSLQWGIVLQEDCEWIQLLPVLEKIAIQKKGFFLFKIDGERDRNRYSFVINLPRPLDVVVRKDTDNFEEGMRCIILELIACGVLPS